MFSDFRFREVSTGVLPSSNSKALAQSPDWEHPPSSLAPRGSDLDEEGQKLRPSPQGAELRRCRAARAGPENWDFVWPCGVASPHQEDSRLDSKTWQQMFARISVLRIAVSPFSTEKALAIKQLWHHQKFQVSPVGSEGLDDAQEVLSRAQPVSQVVQPCTERPSRAMQRRCNASSKLEQMSNSRTRRAIARGLGDSEGCGMNIHQPSHLGHLGKGQQQQVSPTTSRIMRNNPTRPCLSL